METVDHFTAAVSLVDLFGEEAWFRASLRSDTALDAGDVEEARFWQRVAALLKTGTSEQAH
jgi:hypothetical protein